MPCSLIEVQLRIGGTLGSKIEPRKKEEAGDKHGMQYWASTRLQGVTFRQILLFKVIPIETSGPK
jgi:hypothetical protein